MNHVVFSSQFSLQTDVLVIILNFRAFPLKKKEWVQSGKTTMKKNLFFDKKKVSPFSQ